MLLYALGKERASRPSLRRIALLGALGRSRVAREAQANTHAGSDRPLDHPRRQTHLHRSCRNTATASVDHQRAWVQIRTSAKARAVATAATASAGVQANMWARPSAMDSRVGTASGTSVQRRLLSVEVRWMPLVAMLWSVSLRFRALHHRCLCPHPFAERHGVWSASGACARPARAASVLLPPPHSCRETPSTRSLCPSAATALVQRDAQRAQPLSFCRHRTRAERRTRGLDSATAVRRLPTTSSTCSSIRLLWRENRRSISRISLDFHLESFRSLRVV